LPIPSEGIVTAIPHRLLHPAAGEQSFYLPAAGDTTFVTLHRAATASDTAVLICPPFGWEEVCSYRPRRVWAQSLSRAGYSTLRITLPSTGDSGGAVHDPARLAAWTSSLEAAADWLRRETGAHRIVAIGMELGGLLAYRCAALGGGIDELVLWPAVSKGRALLRQFKAFSRLEGGQFFDGLPLPPALPDGEMEAGGFRLSAETVRDLELLDLVGLELPESARRRALLLERDGLAADTRLRDHLTEMGVAVTIAPGGGYADMTSHPQFAEPANAVFSTVARWIGEVAAPLGSARTPADSGQAPAAEAMPTQLGGTDAAGWTETPITIERPAGRLSGILVSPRRPTADGLCAVLLNAGAVRRIGPSRMWVETARRWAERGVPTLRLDVHAIGDSDGAAVGYPDDSGFHRDELVADVRSAFDFLQETGAGDRFFVGGLCSGAYWAFQTAGSDPRVCAVAMLNPRVLVWHPGVAPARYVRTLLSERPSPSRIRQVVTPALARDVLRWLLREAVDRLTAAPRRWLGRRSRGGGGPADGTGDIDELLTQLIESGKRALFLFSEREPLYDELFRAGRIARLQSAPAVTIERLAVADHTLRPSWAQNRAQDALDAALTRELGGSGDAVSSAAEPV
jgi:dienelactone hydrolase